MDDKIRRAEQLLEERARPRTNGHAVPESEAPESEGSAGSIPEDPKVAELTNDLKRLAADFSNYRKRNEAERTDFAKFAKADLIAKLLDVLDGYDRALATVPDDLKGQPWVEGMWLVERKLRAILEGEGLEAVDSLGTPFDPYLHQAVTYVPSEKPEGTVIEEHQKAYRLHDRVIRPALVTVSSGSEEKEKQNG
ncbi:MAG: nucleotide exchange factor GrpE [Chloroflexi bacterium]|nr:MAG: nucleotide exchange factor GrpE [Chloroflexota bacterium]TMG71120.1 MAG: nucleotide exchange factor GrpE [Chloroflexota bacterium]